MISCARNRRLQGVKLALLQGANVNAQDEVCKRVTI